MLPKIAKFKVASLCVKSRQNRRVEGFIYNNGFIATEKTTLLKKNIDKIRGQNY